ncbi:MAG: biopolymer transporter ExbD [Phycisphaerales bacterium]|nr:biopolymer transporter ExbD [Phycisphaerales bacterium]
MRRVRRTSPEVRLEMAPLIDVVFLLLTFFVFAMLLMVRAQVLDVTLPTLGSGEPAQDTGAVTITLDAEGGVFVDEAPTGREGLIEAVRARLEARPGAKISLAADTGCPSGDLLAVIDELSKAGYGSFQLFGRPADGGGD